MLSRTVEYALRAAVHLASNNGVPQRTIEVAEATKVPFAYLSKILQGLRRNDIVHLQRGLHGGVSLARAPELLTILDIVNAVDPIQRIHRCPLAAQFQKPSLCALHRKLDETFQTIEEAFRSTSIADLIQKSDPDGGLCD